MMNAKDESGPEHLPRNLVFSKAIVLARSAADLDEQGNHEQALHVYVEAVELFDFLQTGEPDADKRQLFASRAADMHRRIEALRGILAAKRPPEPAAAEKSALLESAPPQAGSPDDPTEALPVEAERIEQCEILMALERVECWTVVGTSKELISSGTLNLLKAPSGELHLLSLGEFEFPLTEDVPCLNTAPGYYMLPMPGNVVYAFVLHRETPEAYLQIFDSVLERVCMFRKQPGAVRQPAPPPAPPTTELVSVVPPADRTVTVFQGATRGLEIGSKFLVQGITYTGNLVSAGVQKGGELLKRNLRPSNSPLVVGSTASRTLQVASVAAPTCVAVSSAILKGLEVMAVQIGSAIGEGVSKQFKSSGRSSPAVDAAKHFGRSAVGAILDVWDSLEAAGEQIVQATRETSVDVIEHKYGSDAGEFANKGLSVATDVGRAVHNLRQLGVRRIAKRVVKHTGKHAAKTYLEVAEQPPPALESAGQQRLLQN